MRLILSMVCLGTSLVAQVPYERIVHAVEDPGNWLTYSGGYSGFRFSPLKQLTAANVSRLRVRWVYQLDAKEATEVTPLVADRVMYVSEPNMVKALDLGTGRPLWEWSRPIPKDLKRLGFGWATRGVALLDDMVYVGTLDSHLVALDAKSGAVRWDTEVDDYHPGRAITSAPLAILGKIITGISGSEAGIRGYLDAYDAKTGKRLWRVFTIPAPGEPGFESWSGDAWKIGGGATWGMGTYDPDLNLIYWGSGNPGPAENGDTRPGDNLYTCSLLAVDADSGKLKWHFQFTPHDTHDWDSTEIPVLVNATVLGRSRKLVAMANRNAFYLLDRTTGEFLVGAPFARQTWAKGLNDQGRPIPVPGQEPSIAGTLTFPSVTGATNWFSPSYSPVTGLFYVEVREMGSYYYKGESKYKPGIFWQGGGEETLGGDKSYGAIRALELATGKRKWEFRLHSPGWAGVLSTAGGLVFGASFEGNFYALDAQSGKPLWDFQAGGMIQASPISFMIDGRQHVAVSVNRAVFVFGL